MNPKVELTPMPESNYASYMAEHLREYIKDRMLTDFESETEARENVLRQWSQTIPNGHATLNHYFFDIRDTDTGKEIGHVWLRTDPKLRVAWLLHIVIYADKRRKGYGRAAMKLIVKKATDLGARVLWLNVMGHNQIAQELYKSVGMNTAAIHMNILLEEPK